MWFLIVKWWYTLWFKDRSLQMAWDTPSNRGGWALLLAKRFGGIIVIWKDENDKTMVGLVLGTYVYQPDAERRDYPPEHVLCYLCPRDEGDILCVDKRKCQYYINKVR